MIYWQNEWIWQIPAVLLKRENGLNQAAETPEALDRPEQSREESNEKGRSNCLSGKRDDDPDFSRDIFTHARNSVCR
jgi:hypothetical protein